MEPNSKKILIAPLNWGIGHATRCVPIINALLKQGFIPIIASDGKALEYLQTEFPTLKSYELPAYNIKYAKQGKLLKFKLFFQTAKVLKAIRKERKSVAQLIQKENIKGIISDNRFGVFSNKVPSVYITHQVQVLSGFTTFLTSKIHQKSMRKYDECWIPDFKKKPHLAGKLSKIENSNSKFKYIGLLSRFKNPTTIQKKYNILVLLSGEEPQRTLLEKKLIKTFKNDERNILFVRGKINEKTTLENIKNIKFINFLTQNKLEKAINESELIIARSGYSTIMDLAVLQKKAFFIPTPGQTEQEYLATHLQNLKIAPFAIQHEFKIKNLNKINDYSGFNNAILPDNNFPFELFN